MIDFVEEVDEFIRRRNNGEITVTDVANNMWYAYNKPANVPIGFDQKYKMVLSECVANSIKDYVFNEDPEATEYLAKVCYKWINIGWSIGGFKHDALAKQLLEYKEENVSLKKELEMLSTEYKRLEKQLKAIQSRFKLETEDEGRENHT